jgi:hypothetical protein
MNADGDDLGDACDAAATPQQRMLFDGFGAIEPAWARIGEWRANGDAAETVDGPHPFGYRLTKALPIIQGQRVWTMEISFEVPSSPDEGYSIGGYVIDQGGTVVWACTILYENATWNLTNGLGSPITLGAGPAKMTLSSQRNGMTDRYCTIAGAVKTNLGPTDMYPMGVELWTNRPSRFHYIEVIE